ncbi:MAG: hydantoinase/oxoprolinase family protein [Nitriliruptorales bacterium]|nr:hydantoinase/oxoprolinase family protein [Nitriliruptorales bacterium]
MSPIRVGVDTGGTFTDFAFLDEATGEITIAKVSSTPSDLSLAVLDGLESSGMDPSAAASFCHGTTVGTNALLEERGADAALVITEGFRGVYEAMEQARPYGRSLFDIDYVKPRLLVPQSRTVEVPERVAADGTVLRPLDTDAVRAALAPLRVRPPQSVAVCLLFAFLHPEHERTVAEVISEELPGAEISLSSEVLPQIREYYRLSTTVINAYLVPLLSGYLGRLGEQLSDRGVQTRQRYVMQSNGGTSSFSHTARKAVSTILSGPAGGVTAGMALLEAIGERNAVTFDMGGTSCDVALIRDGAAALSTMGIIDGRHVAVPMMDINTVSAGGGTIARVDELGALEVGPRSAGADPGPACYGCGGELPTVTDANAVLGYLEDGARMGADLRLDRSLAERAVRMHVAEPLGLSPMQAAEGIVRIVNTKMEEAIKAISTMRGHDLRAFTLLAFGGAGPVHAGAMMADLGMTATVVPLHAGVFSSLGLLMADVRHDYVTSRLERVEDLDAAEADGVLDSLAQAARKELRDEGFAEDDIDVQYGVDLRYEGQGYELTVPSPPALRSDEGLARLREAFDALHRERFGHAAPDSPVEVVSYRVTGIGRTPQGRFPTTEPTGRGIAGALAGSRRARFQGIDVDCPVYRRALLDVGERIAGPCIVEQPDATVVVNPGQEATVDRFRNLVITPEEGR